MLRSCLQHGSCARSRRLGACCGTCEWAHERWPAKYRRSRRQWRVVPDVPDSSGAQAAYVMSDTPGDGSRHRKSETAAEASKSDVGEGPARRPVVTSRIAHRLSQCADAVFNGMARGVGQVSFANNPLSGIAIMAALCVPLPASYALLGLIGVVSSVLCALWLGLDASAIRNGLFGFNGVLVGQAAATFLVLDTETQLAVACGQVALFAAASTLLSQVLTQALGNLLVPVHGFPPFTLPFNIATLALLLFVGTSPTSRLHLVPGLQPAAGATPAPSYAPDPAGDDGLGYYDDLGGAYGIVEAIFRGVAQIWLCNNAASGMVVVVAIGLFSPISAVMATIGSIVGLCVAMAFGVPAASISAGLWGYNGSLGATAVGGMFFLLTWRTAALAVACAALCTAIQGGLSGLFAAAGMPVLTLPFCFGTIVTVLLRAPPFQPISLATMATPEAHLRRFWELLRLRGEAQRATLRQLAQLYSAFRQVRAQHVAARSGPRRVPPVKPKRDAYFAPRGRPLPPSPTNEPATPPADAIPLSVLLQVVASYRGVLLTHRSQQQGPQEAPVAPAPIISPESAASLGSLNASSNRVTELRVDTESPLPPVARTSSSPHLVVRSSPSAFETKSDMPVLPSVDAADSEGRSGPDEFRLRIMPSPEGRSNIRTGTGGQPSQGLGRAVWVPFTAVVLGRGLPVELPDHAEVRRALLAVRKRTFADLARSIGLRRGLARRRSEAGYRGWGGTGRGAGVFSDV